MSTPNLISENIEKIADLFPGCIVEAEDELGNKVRKVDFDLLKAELWDQASVEWLDERYRLDWPGKKRSILKANTPITKTLRPVKEDSVDWDTTQNLYIEGDNFEVLKILQESYLWKVKMIYIDPPYNTGNDFVYNDDFSQDASEYKEKTEQNAEWYKMVRNLETNGRFHSDWLSMMYERLKISYDVLKASGLIYISISDVEVSNLRKICDEIFWEKNFVAQFVWTNKEWGWWSDTKLVKVKHEYIICYAKSAEEAEIKWVKVTDIDRYTCGDKWVETRWKYQLVKLDSASLWYIASLDYPIEAPDGSLIYPNKWDKKISRRRWWKEKLLWWKENDFVEFKKDREWNWAVYSKQYLNADTEWNIVERTNRPFAIIDKYSSTQASKQLQELMWDKCFSYSKPKDLIKFLIEITTDKNDIVLDFFSGSATTAHSCMQLNAEEKWNRKYIMVQLPELCDENSEAYKNWYKTIYEIWKERISRAWKKIKEETWADIDYWFRVYRVDESCMKDVFYHPSEAKQEDLWFFTSNIKEDRTSEDLLTQVILNFGLTLDLPIEEKQIWNSKVFYVAWNSLLACFDDNILDETIEIIAKEQPIKLVFRDSCFKDDSQRINVENKVKRLSPETIIKVI